LLSCLDHRWFFDMFSITERFEGCSRGRLRGWVGPYNRHCRGRRWKEPLSLFGGELKSVSVELDRFEIKARFSATSSERAEPKVRYEELRVKTKNGKIKRNSFGERRQTIISGVEDHHNCFKLRFLLKEILKLDQQITNSIFSH
jgi:hypothetical protein